MFLERPQKKSIILRHDVDKLPLNSLLFAQIHHDFGIKSSFYFRIVPKSFDEKIIRKIDELGHEIGYHYEDMDLVWRERDHRQWTIDRVKKIQNNGESFKARESSVQKVTQSPNLNSKNIEDTRPSSMVHGPSALHQAAIKSFQKNLTKLRQITPITTICMHGSPRSPFDNKELWNHYNYRDYGIIGEPYFDIDFTKVAYYTDTGRMWDGDKYSVRDRISAPKNTDQSDLHAPPPLGGEAGRGAFPSFHSTQQIIKSLQSNTFPPQAMLTFHPQRWTNNPILWTKELALQSIKNIIKKHFFVK